MAEMAVSLVIDQLLPLLREEAKLYRGIHKEFAEIKDELESIQAFLKDADKRSATTEGVKTWVKHVREAAFRIEDIIDDYLIQVGQQPRDHGCVSLLHKLKAMISRRRIAYEIQDIKSYVRGIKERSERYGFQRSLEQGPSNSREIRNSKWHDPRLAALYMEESEVVGFEEPRKRLIDWMVKGRDERTVVSVLGMGGQGKTTLAKKVFDSKDVVRHFDYRVWITVSQSYNVEELLREILIKVCKQKGDEAPRDISQMDRGSLTEEVRNYLQQKRSRVRSLFVYGNDAPRSMSSWRIATKFRLLKVLDYERVKLFPLPHEVGSLIHLKYLRLNCYRDIKLPKSIGMLQNLETLEATSFSTLELPKEISKLRKLRHLIGTKFSLTELKNGIGEMTSLQTLRNVGLHMDGAAEIIKELGKLKQIRDLGLLDVLEEDGIVLSASINEMQHLDKLNVELYLLGNKSIGLDLISSPMMLQKISLRGRLKKLPNLISELQNLVVLRLMWSYLTRDPMQSLKSLQHLLILSVTDWAYDGLGLHFEDGGFQKLKELYVEGSDELRVIIIEKGALPSLKKLQLLSLFNLKNLPKGILHLEKLEVLNIQHKYKLEEDIYTEDLNWITEHMPTVKINYYAT